MGRPRTGTGYVNLGITREHRLVVEAAGIKLASSDVVHHKDGNPRNNCLGNLEVMSVKDHRKLHAGTFSEPDAFEYVPEECPSCHLIHMVQYRCTKRPNYTGLCKSCNGRLNGIHKGNAN